MRILLVSATKFELDLALNNFHRDLHKNEISTLITGVGMIATTYQLSQLLAKEKFDLAINVGIAGAFDRNLELGEVVEVVEDQFAEERIEDGEFIKSYEEVGLRKGNEFPFVNGRIHATYEIPVLEFKKVNAITVNTVHGNEKSIATVKKELNPQIESMEGAAFFYVCQQMKVPSIQLRAISNYVEKRNRNAWKMELALNNLAAAIQKILSQL